MMVERMQKECAINEKEPKNPGRCIDNIMIFMNKTSNLV